ncbi:MAG: glucose-6-phosphate isomerase, partial [Acidobacteria bacterium]|nr:glucose-6-phosphate isomerase [Acidobacteriota bacterium]
RAWLERALASGAAGRITAVTSAGRGDLAALAARSGYATFPIPENVGGRFSVLSAAGLLPAALLGIDIARLARGAARFTASCWRPDLDENLALRAALCHWLLLTTRNKPIQVAFPYSNYLWGAAFWFRQLWAESLGKARDRAGRLVNAGQTPVAALGATDQHSQVQLYVEGPNDKVFTFWTLERFRASGSIPRPKLKLPAFDALAGQSLARLIEAEQRATAAALVAAQRPNCAFILGRLDEEHLGAFLQLQEFQTAFMGELLDINAFDQEGVELGKKLAFGLLGRQGFEPYRDQFQAYEANRAALKGNS